MTQRRTCPHRPGSLGRAGSAHCRWAAPRKYRYGWPIKVMSSPTAVAFAGTQLIVAAQSDILNIELQPPAASSDTSLEYPHVLAVSRPV